MTAQPSVRNRGLRRRIFTGFLAALGVAAVVPAAPRWRGPIAQSLMRGYVAEPLAAGTLRPSERAFLEKAVAASREQVRLAKLAVGQATASEVRDFAQQLATDHQSLGNTIADLQRRKGAAAPTGSEAPEPASDFYRRVAQKSGAEFDREFVRAMSDLHTEFIALFEQAVGDAKDPEVRELAGAFLPTLREHQNRLSELRKTHE